MGMCQYALKARFPRGRLGKVFTDVQAFWRQGQSVRDWYESHRNCTEQFYDKDCKLDRSRLKEFKLIKGSFWDDFRKNFPQIAEMLKLVKDHGHVDGTWTEFTPVMTHDPRNALAGHISFGDQDDEPSSHGDIMTFTAEVTRSTDWNPLAKYLKKKFKATAVKWCSEEGTSLTDFLDV